MMTCISHYHVPQKSHNNLLASIVCVCVSILFLTKTTFTFYPSSKTCLHPWKLTWNLKLTHLQRKMIYLNQTTSMTKSVPAVHFPGCSWHMSRVTATQPLRPNQGNPAVGPQKSLFGRPRYVLVGHVLAEDFQIHLGIHSWEFKGEPSPPIWRNMGVSKIVDVSPQNGWWKSWKTPIFLMDDLGGKPTILGNPHMLTMVGKIIF